MKENRLQLLVNMVRGHGRSDECLIWPHTKFMLRGKFKWYGEVMANGRKDRCHRVAYELFKGRIPRGKKVLHKCDNPPCFNPRHLFIGTQADNMRDMTVKGRHGFPHIPKGEANARAVLSQKQADEIRHLYKAGVKGSGASTLAKKFGVSKQTVQRVVRRQTYK